ncbi:acyl carrier protein [Actinomadura sp. WMMB 499]|uniref:acyl carrier protein n=1 Tax=Actinomadura sp. WMMB 499 TaxID=1219491 RepID=UPI0012471046|nr:acyl carrier protein [Actinomadura sp. WMMB 499]QFG20249.1 acyl carrier protein [Actinomadura sp. WMMB 499]
MTIDDLVALVRDELGLPVTVESAGQTFDHIPGWDSMHLLWLVTTLERQTGRSLSMPDLLEAASLENVHALVTAS